MSYQFGSFEVDVSNFHLLENGKTVAVEPQVFDLLVYLVANRHRVVSRQELFGTIWKGRVVSDTSLNNHIKSARKAVGDNGKLQQIIKTIHGRGYQFIAHVEELPDEPSEDTRTPATGKKTIAVLAFTDLSPNHDQEYFSDGISEELINLLDKIPELKVISRTSSFSYKGQNRSIREIASDLGATHILEGSVRKSGNDLRISAHLVQASDSVHLWSETYCRTLDDIFRTQDDIAESVTRQLQLTLFGKRTGTTPADPDAYSLYLQANHMHQKFTAEGSSKAEALVTQSIAIDSAYAPSWLLLSRILFRETSYLYQKPFADGLRLSEAAVLNAIELDDNCARAYAQLSLINIMNWDFTSSIANIHKAMTLNPDDSEILGTAAHNAMDLGRLHEAEELLKKAIDMDPFAAINYYNLGIVYLWLGRFDEALNAVRKYDHFRTDAALQHTTVSFIFLRQGMYEEALKEAEKEPHEFWKLYTQHCVFFAMGQKKKADNLLNAFTRRYGRRHPTTMAYLYACRKEVDSAFEWLETAYEQRDPNLVMKLNYTYFGNLHHDPRWRAFIIKMGFPDGHWLLERLDVGHHETLLTPVQSCS
jgi:TolB-like protein/tetratricopeptide (TPR) repeat protein